MLNFKPLNENQQTLISDFVVHKLDKREIRIQFFGKNEKLNQEKYRLKLFLFTISLLIIFGIVGASVNLSEKQLTFIFIALMALIFLFSIMLPFIIASKTIQRSKASTMIQEYFLSKFGRYLVRLQFYILTGFSVVIIILMIILGSIPVRKFVSFNAEKKIQISVVAKLSSIDLKIIESHQIPFDLKIYAFARTRGESLNSSFGQSPLEKIEESIPLKMENLTGKTISLTKTQIVMIWLILSLFFIFINFLTEVLPYEIAARKYYMLPS